MLQIHDVRTTNFDEIDIDSFWNVGTSPEHKRHKIHAYPAKFPAFITSKAIEYALAEGVHVEAVADIFCGCGTVAFEAKRQNIDFWGCDLNPTAVLIAKAKSDLYNIKKIDAHFSTIISEYERRHGQFSVASPINDRISYWFFPKQIDELSLLKQCILDVIPRNSKYRRYFLCAFSNILKPTSKWLTKSIKPQIDPDKQPACVMEAFMAQCAFMHKCIEPSLCINASKSIIKEKNALSIRSQRMVDLIITSPPYVTSYEYADLHQLSTLWLGYADDYRELRKNSIGSAHDTSYQVDVSLLNASGRDIVDSLREVDRSKAKAVAKYYLDMQRITSICKNMLRSNGMALMVIGNTEYKGVHINNAKHLTESMYASGFTRVDVTKRKISGKILTPFRDSEGRFSSTPNARKVYSEEFIVIGR